MKANSQHTINIYIPAKDYKFINYLRDFLDGLRPKKSKNKILTQKLLSCEI